MGLARPTGEYAKQMLAPDGWPDVDEDANYRRAYQYTQVLAQITEVLDNCRRRQAEIFDGRVWSGAAAGAANRELGTNIDALTALQDGLRSVIGWHEDIVGSIMQAKSKISDNVADAHQQINALKNEALNNARLTPAKLTSEINKVLIAAYAANADVVTVTAEQILASRVWKPPNNALQELLERKKRSPGTLPDESPHVLPTPESDPVPPGPVTPPAGPGAPPPAGPGAPPPAGPGAPPSAGPGAPPPAGPGAPPPAGPVAPAPVGPALPRPSVPGVPAGVPLPTPGTSPVPGGSPVSPAAAAGVPTAAVPGSGPRPARGRAASAPSGGAGDGDEDPAAPASAEAPSSGGQPQDSSPRVSPASASGMPAMPMAPGAAGGGGAAGAAASGGGAVSGLGAAPAGEVPRGVRPAAGTSRAAGRDPAARRESTDRAWSVEGAARDVIPVSAARAERDAIAEAARTGAQRRSGADRLQLARRIAGALNVPVNERPDFGFFWVTGLTTDGAIVVANNYGLAYIPKGVQLPERVFMASADEAIPVGERARWATYPVIAVQRWAAHRNSKLRAVIATEEQLADWDPGAAKVVLKSDDIPDSGEMIGRSRLEVADPKAAQRLADTRDGRLLALLPPAPADASPPADQRQFLWLQVMKPVLSPDPLRQAPHLQAFHDYAIHAQEVVANEARTAVDPVARRCAAADWLYWKHLTRVLHAALSAAFGGVAPPVAKPWD
jgi:hypothetical protein